MDKNLKEQLEICRKKIFADGLRKNGEWNGHIVYEPIYKEEFIGGLPHIVLVKDGEARISSHEECFVYMDFIRSKEKGSV